MAALLVGTVSLTHRHSHFRQGMLKLGSQQPALPKHDLEDHWLHPSSPSLCHCMDTGPPWRRCSQTCPGVPEPRCMQAAHEPGCWERGLDPMCTSAGELRLCSTCPLSCHEQVLYCIHIRRLVFFSMVLTKSKGRIWKYLGMEIFGEKPVASHC